MRYRRPKMPRPRIEGMDEGIIESFLSRKIYSSQKEVISEALKALVREQKQKETAAAQEDSQYGDETYSQQIESIDSESNCKSP
jgi:Arc/MetJ-type ribon-helix-helix transcriptional regulator